MSKLLFSEKDIKTLSKNSNILLVSSKSITYAGHFKRRFVEEYLLKTFSKINELK